MHVNRNDIPAKIDVPGAVARQATGFGDTPRARSAASSSPSGPAPTSRRCSRGSRTTPARLRTGATWSRARWSSRTPTAPSEQCSAQDLFHWPPGHSVRVLEDAEVVLFSPQDEHGHVMDHMLARMAGA